MMMAGREVALEDLLGRVVRTAAGRPVGRIEDLRVEPDGVDYVVREIVLGELGLGAWFFGMAAQLPTFRALGLGKRYRLRAIPWQWIDLSDVEHPRFVGEDGKVGKVGRT
jgi:hypothetical protein